MNKESLEVLNIVQQVLRHLMVTLAAGNKANLGNIGSLLEAAAMNMALEPMARQMLADLAAGATALHVVGAPKQ